MRQIRGIVAHGVKQQSGIGGGADRLSHPAWLDLSQAPFRLGNRLFSKLLVLLAIRHWHG